MKRLKVSILFLCLIFALCACTKDDKRIFMATVIENTDALLVEPYKDSVEYTSSDRIVVHADKAIVLNSQRLKINVSDIVAGQTVRITYNGVVAESYPAQIWAYKIMIVE
ncbi:DUF3221 domain-containing protein [Parasporobacterium paucivorans]|uniref:DUF3221 domain-containing protein n=1 Tax=Parasporobacterium paucivorans DSM 15970 TaxID=1122934 RepID=A0A1M6HXB1_9FIRM|nr:DUF3221 domain-containing protein [Parasporobacterium paucivorans]SHJ26851.1 Protein of unknown function [Parasporobacterium paucivorans DSM 15970]